MIQLKNVSALCKFNCKFDLKLLATKVPDCRYRPTVFSGIVWKSSQPRGTVLIFSSGKCMLVGIKSLEDAKKLSLKLKILLSNSESSLTLESFEYTNLVSSNQLDFEIDLRKLATEDENAQWEPELFPALVYKDRKNKVTALIFYQGKIIQTGSKSVEILEKSFESLAVLLKNYKR